MDRSQLLTYKELPPGAFKPRFLFQFVDQRGTVVPRPAVPPRLSFSAEAFGERPDSPGLLTASAGPEPEGDGAAGSELLLGRLIVPAETRAQVAGLIRAVRAAPLVYDTWGLRSIAPTPQNALTFQGPSGTGKTLAARAVAAALGKKTVIASVPQMESRLRRGGADTLESAFTAAGREDGILVLDDADTLLFCAPPAGAADPEHAALLRSRLLRCLDKYSAVVILTATFSGPIHPALEARAPRALFPLPDAAAQAEIWESHLPPELPLAEDVTLDALIEASPGFTGRDIKIAVLRAATAAAVEGSPSVTLSHFLSAIRQLGGD